MLDELRTGPRRGLTEGGRSKSGFPGAPLLLLALAACGGGDTSPVAITHTLRVDAPPDRVHPSPTSDDRFLPFEEFMRRRRAEMEAEQGGARSLAEAIAFEAPPTWRQVPASQFRDLNFVVGEDGACEAWVSFLQGDAGGELANLDRWRGQVGLGPGTREELEGYPSIAFFTTTAPFVQLAQPGDAPDRPALLGTFLQAPMGMLFAKLVGPHDRVQAEVENFRAFCASLSLGAGGGSGSTARAPGADPHGAPTGDRPAPFEPPAGWARGADRAMRLVTYEIGEHTECYVSQAGGALLDNANRWLKQMSLEPLTAQQLAELPTVPFGGGVAVLVEGRGSFDGGMGAEALDDAALLGAIVELDGERQSLFVKMIGSPAEVEGAREGFFDLLEYLAQEAP